jgi:phosphoheptose isomerase
VGSESDASDSLDTPEIIRLQTVAKETGVADKVTFVGKKNRDQLKYYYNAADVFVDTPWYEPFGITPLESMACGTPVIGANVGGIKFSVVDGKTGYLVPAEEPKILAGKVTTLLENEKIQATFRENAIKRVNTFFTWSTVAQSVATMYEKVLYTPLSLTNTYEQEVDTIDRNFSRLAEVVEKTKHKTRIPLLNAAKLITHCLFNGGKILICGNGGSASDSQHFATELVGHFQLDKRSPLPVMSLTSDTAILTAIANDFEYKQVFSRQVTAFGNEGDIFIGISTSGTSKNVLEALKAARKKNLICIGLLGKDGGTMRDLCDIAIIVPDNDTQRIQELHTHLIHTLCELIEKQLFVAETVQPKIEYQQMLIGSKNGRALEKREEK